MKLISALVLLVLFFVVAPVRADYASAYTDYTFNYSKYRDSYNAYQVSKSTYTTYKTLTAQTDAIAKLKTVIQARDKVMASYYDLLQEKLNATTGIPSDSQATFFQMKTSEKSWMADHQKKIDAAATLDDLNLASSVFESHYPQFDSETKQVVGMVLIAKETNLAARWDVLATGVSDKRKEINLAGENTTLGERDVISARNKKDLTMTDITAVQTMLIPQNNQKTDLFGAQQKLSEANQYLKEGTNYLLEIIKGITG